MFTAKMFLYGLAWIDLLIFVSLIAGCTPY